MRQAICNVCGPIALSVLFTVAQLGPDHHGDVIHVRHPDHTPEPGGYRLSGGISRTSAASNGTATTAIMDRVTEFSIGPGAFVLFPPDDDF